MAALVQAMDRVGVTHAGNGALRGGDAVTLAFAQRYPERFLPFAGQVGIGQIVTSEKEKAWRLESQAMRDYLGTLEEGLQAGRWRGIGELFVHNTHTHPSWLPGTRYPADSPLMQRLWDLSARYQVPLSVHMEADSAAIAEMERLLASNRQGIWLWAHTGYSAAPPLLRRLFQAHSNLYCELSWREVTQIGIRIVDNQGRLREDWKALFEEYPDRFVLGTDIATTRPEDYARLVRYWRFIISPVADDAERKIAYQNAERLLRLTVAAPTP